MTQKCILVAGACMLIAGCSQQSSDQIAELQRENSELMLSVSNLQSQVSQLYQYAYIEGHKIDSNSAAIGELATENLQRMADQVKNDSAQPAADSTSDIPADVEAKIEADAAQAFPDNYVMQQFSIQDQQKAYRTLHP